MTSCVVVSAYQHRSTLPTQDMGDVRNPEEVLCKGENRLWPPPSLDTSFPAYSPDGHHYAVLKELWPWEARLRVLEIMKSNTDLHVGRYVSSQRALRVYCWAEDSSGIFVADSDPGNPSIFILFNEPSGRGPIKKLLVPEE